MKWESILNAITALCDLLKIYFKYKMFVSAPNAERELKEKILDCESEIDSYYNKIRNAKTQQEAINYISQRDKLVFRLAELRRDLNKLQESTSKLSGQRLSI